MLNNNQRIFLKEWFGEGCREVGIPPKPFRKFCAHPRDLINYVESTYSKNYPCYMSVLIFEKLDRPVKIDRIYFDFDAPRVGSKWDLERSWNDSTRLKRRLKRKYSIESLIVRSGYGHNLYIFLEDIIKIDKDLNLGKEVFTTITLKLLGVKYKTTAEVRYPTIDLKPIGDLKRISRVPFSMHERNRRKGKTEQRLCVPVDDNGDPFIPDIEYYRENSISTAIVRLTVKSIKEWKEKLFDIRRNRKVFLPIRFRTKKIITNDIRPCISQLMKNPHTDHTERLMITFEFINLGWSDDKIVDVFKKQNDFNEKYTRDQLDHARRREYKRYSCETLKVDGKCVENCGRK